MVLAHNIEEGIRTRDIQISQDVTFETMLLASHTLQGLRNSGFYKPSPVQLHGIPLGKCGFDLLLEAKSGTGKTAVFSVIALEKLDINKGLQVVILAPTREIASQICDVIKQIGGNYSDLAVEVVMGGLPVAEDIEKFEKNVHIVVGSPGRLRHLIQDKHINVSSVRLLVLDEADKLMEKSFLTDINYIFSILPDQKQVIMSSATYPDTTKTFINKYVKSAQHVCPDSNCILLGVEQKITIVKSNTNVVRQTQYRLEELLKILSHKQFKQCLIFCNYQVRVHELYKYLIREKWPVEQLCGQQVQSERLDALKTLQEYKCRILISTDLAARGIDASNVDLVINFEPPFDWQTYLHRIGRAGRYGSYGMAITIIAKEKEETEFKKILELINLNEIKVSNFWTSYKMDATTQGILESDTKPLNKYETTALESESNEFWKLLVSDQIIEKEIEDFEILFKSFEESKLPTIESFTDLLNSYKTASCLNQENAHYQHMNLKSNIINQFFMFIKSLEVNNDNIRRSNIKPKKEHVVKDNNDNDICETSYHLKQIQPEESIINVPTDSQELPHHRNKIKHDEYPKSCEKITANSSSKALLDAGLPSSFEKSRPVKKKINKKDQFNNELSNHSIKNNYTGNLLESNDYDTNVSQYKTKNTYKKSRKSIQHNTNVNERYTCNSTKDACSSKAAINVVSDYNYSKDYINWYKQLKTRVKYFELAVYMDEISKL